MNRSSLLITVAIIIILILVGYSYVNKSADEMMDTETGTTIENSAVAAQEAELKTIEAEISTDLDAEFEAIDAELETL